MDGYAKETARPHGRTHGAKCRPRGDALEPQPIWRINQHDDLRIIADRHEHRADDLAGFADLKDFSDLQFNRIGSIELRVPSLRVAHKYNEHQQPYNHCDCNLHAVTSIISNSTMVLPTYLFGLFLVSSISVKYLLPSSIPSLPEVSVHKLHPEDLCCLVCTYMFPQSNKQSSIRFHQFC